MTKLRYILLFTLLTLSYFVGTVFATSFEEAKGLLKQEENVYTTPNMPDYDATKEYPQASFGAMVRLEVDGQFLCSGTVISDDYVLTAAHCLMRSGFNPGLRTEKITIRAEGQLIPNIGYAAALNQRADYGLIRGNFVLNNKARLSYKPRTILDVGPVVMSCGFPWGAEDTCYRAYNLQPFYATIAAVGVMFPGMSGGPVIDVLSGRIFAVNSGLTPNAVIFAPLVGLFESLNVKVIE